MATCIMAMIRDSWSASLHPNVKLSRFAAKAALKAVSFQSMTGSAAARPGDTKSSSSTSTFFTTPSVWLSSSTAPHRFTPDARSGWPGRRRGSPASKRRRGPRIGWRKVGSSYNGVGDECDRSGKAGGCFIHGHAKVTVGPGCDRAFAAIGRPDTTRFHARGLRPAKYERKASIHGSTPSHAMQSACSSVPLRNNRWAVSRSPRLTYTVAISYGQKY